MKTYKYMQSMKPISDLVKIQLGSMAKDAKKPELANSCLNIVSKGWGDRQDTLLDDIIGDVALWLMECQSRVGFALIAIDNGKYTYPDFIRPLRRQTAPENQTDIRYTNALLETRKQIARTIEAHKAVRAETPLDMVIGYDSEGEEMTVRNKAEQLEVLADMTGYYLPEDQWNRVQKVLNEIKAQYPKQHEDAYRIIKCYVNGFSDRKDIARHLNLSRDRVDYIVKTFTRIYHSFNDGSRREVTWVKIPTWEYDWVSVPDETGTHLERVQVPTTTYHKVHKEQRTIDGKRKVKYYDCHLTNPKTGEPLEIKPQERTKSKSYIVDKGIIAKGRQVWHTVYSSSSTVYRGLTFDQPIKIDRQDTTPDSATQELTLQTLTDTDCMNILSECKTRQDMTAVLMVKEVLQGRYHDRIDDGVWQAVKKAVRRIQDGEKQRVASQVWTGDTVRTPVKTFTGCRAVLVDVPSVRIDAKGIAHLDGRPVSVTMYYDKTELTKEGFPKVARPTRITQAYYQRRINSGSHPLS